ncbi:hypothetical protein [Mongoliimonas terrestris]|uniref:hypothetical protein n=1 Tax=Mongoliimonas terrestris TaxID=1709001 RepID=UPI000A9FDB21|nr:hypothetical protein [Mongoliimonas terrestris]
MSADNGDRYWTIKQIVARGRDGSQPNVSKTVGRFVERFGLDVIRDRAGHVRAVDIEQFDRCREQWTNPAKRYAGLGNLPRLPSSPDGSEPQDGQAPAGPRKADSSYEEAMRRRAWAEAERKTIELDSLKGNLIVRASLVTALDDASAAICTTIDRLPRQSDELAAVVAKEGSHGLQVALRKLAGRMRGEIAAALQSIAAAAPAEEGGPSTDDDELPPSPEPPSAPDGPNPI